MTDRLSLTDDTYRNDRYVQLVNNNVPEIHQRSLFRFDYQLQYILITYD